MVTTWIFGVTSMSWMVFSKIEKITWVPPPAFQGTISFAVLQGMSAAWAAMVPDTASAAADMTRVENSFFIEASL
jgi:hypothetical protein